MSEKNVHQFFEQVKNSPEMELQLQTLQESGEKDLLVEVTKLAQENGYKFSEAELRQELEKMSTNIIDEGALDDEQLDAVVGAGCPYCMFTKGSYCFFTK